MSKHVLIIAVLAASCLFTKLFATAEPPAAGGKDPVGGLAAPKIRIVGGARATSGETEFFSFTCEASNPNKAPLMVFGYRADSFDPPTPEGYISPIYSIEFQREGKWESQPIGWCGTGMSGIELLPGKPQKFGFGASVDSVSKLVRIGIHWSKPLSSETGEADSFPSGLNIAWSEPFEMKEIDFKTGGIVHGKSERGLAAFLFASGPRFKVAEPITLTYGVINASVPGEGPPPQTLKVVQPCGAADPQNRSWLSVIGPDGNEIAYRGEFVSRPAPQGGDEVSLAPGRFIGLTTSGDDVNLSFDLKTKGKYRLKWHYEVGELGDVSACKLASNEIEIEVVP